MAAGRGKGEGGGIRTRKVFRSRFFLVLEQHGEYGSDAKDYPVCLSCGPACHVMACRVTCVLWRGGRRGGAAAAQDWFGLRTEIFNAGNYRRKFPEGRNASSDLFDPMNAEVLFLLRAFVFCVCRSIGREIGRERDRAACCVGRIAQCQARSAPFIDDVAFRLTMLLFGWTAVSGFLETCLKRRTIVCANNADAKAHLYFVAAATAGAGIVVACMRSI